MGGDHSVTLPLIRALARLHPGLSLLQVDAHPDLYDHLEGRRETHASPLARIMEEGLVGRLVQVGIRAMNGHQRRQAGRFGVEVHPMAGLKNDLGLDFQGPRLPDPGPGRPRSGLCPRGLPPRAGGADQPAGDRSHPGARWRPGGRGRGGAEPLPGQPRGHGHGGGQAGQGAGRKDAGTGRPGHLLSGQGAVPGLTTGPPWITTRDSMERTRAQGVAW